ncbi:hypothetical protein EVAR_82336_1 [Eumeta japonica]|uniref:Uncharacterized protein n=1 Tax=Eumeta variegata TaxID=151549 RepID=A0A4C1U9Q6_EUMVA|nr:hypothetical protein EVAR_82336_1 [Eumeta japonica]
MKDASKRFFGIAGSHPNALLYVAIDYKPPHPNHFMRRPRNVLNDPPDALTAAVASLNEIPYSTRPPLIASVPGRRKGNPFLVGFSPTLPTRMGARVCDRHFLPPPPRKREKKCIRRSCTPTATCEARP